MDFCRECEYRIGWFTERCSAHAKYDRVSGKIENVKKLPPCEDRRAAMATDDCPDFKYKTDNVVYY